MMCLTTWFAVRKERVVTSCCPCSLPITKSGNKEVLLRSIAISFSRGSILRGRSRSCAYVTCLRG